jgi:hypothetical protein
MLMMPTTMQDDSFCQGREENNNQQTMGARVMTATSNNDARGEGWMTPPETPPWLPLL